MIRLIKRYQNRKLYDTHQSCYVTLNDLESILKSGDEICVMDNKTGRDVTSLTKLMIIFDSAKPVLSPEHNDILSKVIVSEKDLFSLLKEKV